MSTLTGYGKRNTRGTCIRTPQTTHTHARRRDPAYSNTSTQDSPAGQGRHGRRYRGLPPAWPLQCPSKCHRQCCPSRKAATCPQRTRASAPTRQCLRRVPRVRSRSVNVHRETVTTSHDCNAKRGPVQGFAQSMFPEGSSHIPRYRHNVHMRAMQTAVPSCIRAISSRRPVKSGADKTYPCL